MTTPPAVLALSGWDYAELRHNGVLRSSAKGGSTKLAAAITLVPPPLDEFDVAESFEQMQVALDGTHGALEGVGQGLHLGEAQPALVVGIVRKRAGSQRHSRIKLCPRSLRN